MWVYTEPDLILFLCAEEPHCCPKTIKNTSPSHAVALGDHEHTHCGLFWLNPAYTTLLLEKKLTREPDVRSSVAECSPQM